MRRPLPPPPTCPCVPVPASRSPSHTPGPASPGPSLLARASAASRTPRRDPLTLGRQKGPVSLLLGPTDPSLSVVTAHEIPNVRRALAHAGLLQPRPPWPSIHIASSASGFAIATQFSPCEVVARLRIFCLWCVDEPTLGRWGDGARRRPDQLISGGRGRQDRPLQALARPHPPRHFVLGVGRQCEQCTRSR